jgi:hypothetical protein
VEFVLLVVPVLLVLGWTVHRCLRRRAERARIARIRASIAEWLTPEWEDDEAPPDVVEKAPSESDQDRLRWFGRGSAGYHRGRSA